MSLVKVDNISAGYSKTNVIENISFEIDSGELVGILGANGSGKSTLAKSICNVLHHNGNVIVNDSAIETLGVEKVANIISYIPQQSGLSIDISVLDVVKMGFNPRLKFFENPNDMMVNEARHILDTLGLADKQDSNYMMLSEGQKQLTILARALISKGNLLVMDEPESALDFNVRIQTINAIRKWINNKNRAGLIILHDVSLALNSCDKIILLKEKHSVATIDIHNDSIEEMENKLKIVYGDISLFRIKNKMGKDNLIMLYEAGDT